MERSYFDAKFEGLEKMMMAQQANLTNHVDAVSRNVKRVEADLTAHRESTDVHGAAAGRRSTDALLKYAGLFLSAIAIAIGLRKHP